MVIPLEQGMGHTFFQGRAESLLALKQAYPEEVRQYLRPLLERLTGKNVLRPGPVELLQRLFRHSRRCQGYPGGEGFVAAVGCRRL